MDWIEQWFGVSPDNGDGSLEVLIVAAVAVAAILVFAALHRRTRLAIVRRFPGMGGRASPARTRTP